MGNRNMWTESFKAMGTDVEIGIAGAETMDHEAVTAAYQKARETIYYFESVFTRFRENSELSYINAHSGAWLTVSPEMLEVLALARDAHAASNGLFNPCLGTVMEDVGYTQTFEHVRDGVPASNGSVRSRTNPSSFKPMHANELSYILSENFKKVYLFPDYKLDLGGIAKGWIVERASHVLRDLGITNFIVSAGGDMVCSGSNEGMPWQIGITNPWALSESILTLKVESSCIATSGTYRRRWKQGIEEMHHMIDPVTNRPSQSDVVSCTVVAPLRLAHMYFRQDA